MVGSEVFGRSVGRSKPQYILDKKKLEISLSMCFANRSVGHVTMTDRMVG